MERHLVDEEIDRPFGELIQFQEGMRPERAVFFEPKHQGVGRGGRFEGGAFERDCFPGASGPAQDEHERSGWFLIFEEDLKEEVFLGLSPDIVTPDDPAPAGVIALVKALRELLRARHAGVDEGEIGCERDPQESRFLSVCDEKLADRKVGDIGDGRQGAPERRDSGIEALHELAEAEFEDFDVLGPPKINVVLFGVGGDDVPAGTAV
jgi:hypothetical protein